MPQHGRFTPRGVREEGGQARRRRGWSRALPGASGHNLTSERSWSPSSSARTSRTLPYTYPGRRQTRFRIVSSSEGLSPRDAADTAPPFLRLPRPAADRRAQSPPESTADAALHFHVARVSLRSGPKHGSRCAPEREQYRRNEEAASNPRIPRKTRLNTSPTKRTELKRGRGRKGLMAGSRRVSGLPSSQCGGPNVFLHQYPGAFCGALSVP